MKLHQFDGQCVRLVDQRGDVFEGVCSHNNADYDEHEFGRREEALEIEEFLFFRSDIRSVVSLEGRDGPYGRFTGPFGTLEEQALEGGPDYAGNRLESEEDEHVLRMLLCLEARRPSWLAALRDDLRRLAREGGSAAIRATAGRLLQAPDETIGKGMKEK